MNVRVRIKFPDGSTRTVIAARDESEDPAEDNSPEAVGERIAALQGGELLDAELTEATFTAYTVAASPDDIG